MPPVSQLARCWPTPATVMTASNAMGSRSWGCSMPWASSRMCRCGKTDAILPVQGPDGEKPSGRRCVCSRFPPRSWLSARRPSPHVYSRPSSPPRERIDPWFASMPARSARAAAAARSSGVVSGPNLLAAAQPAWTRPDRRDAVGSECNARPAWCVRRGCRPSSPASAWRGPISTGLGDLGDKVGNTDPFGRMR
jgi:hypothetical protein